MSDLPPPPGPWSPPPARTPLPFGADAPVPTAHDVRGPLPTGLMPAGPLPAGPPPTGPAATMAGKVRRRGRGFELLGVLILAAVAGAFVLLAVDAWMPRRTEAGTVVDREIERRSVRRNGRSTTETDHVVLGRTASGEAWRIVSRDVYDLVDVGDRVELQFSRLSGRVVRVTNDAGSYDERSGVLPWLCGVGAVAAIIGYGWKWRGARRRGSWPVWIHPLALAAFVAGAIIASQID